MPLNGWKDVIIRTAGEASKDNAGLIAAGVAFYAFIAIVPTLGAIVLAYGLFASPATVLLNMQALAKILPGDVATLITDQLLGVVTASSGKKGFGIFIALAISVFGARNASGAIIKALNIAYEEDEKRGFVKVTLLAIAMTVAGVVCALAGVAIVTAMRFLASLIPNAPEVVLIVLRVLAGLIVLAGAATGAATLYRYAPSREKAKWTWLTPGTAVAAVGWLALFLGFGLYVTRFANFNATYGSLGAVIILMLWFYLTGAAILIGGEFNSEIEHAAAERGAPDANKKGEKAPGEKDAKGKSREAKNLSVASQTSTVSRPQIARQRTHTEGARSFSLGKVAVVLGAWVVSKVTGFNPKKRSR